MNRAKRHLLTVLAAAASVAALAIAGCGDDDGGGAGGDLADFAPSGSPFYMEATIRPEGELRDSIEQFSSNLAGIDDPGEQAIAYINNALGDGEGGGLTYEDDVEPWLGEEAAMFLTSFSEDESFAFVVSTTDSDAAQAAIDKAAKESGAETEAASYEGTDFTLAPDGEAAGIVEGALVLAPNRKSFEAAVDAADGDSLADDESFNDVLDEAPEGSLTNLYVDLTGQVDELRSSLDADSRQFFEAIGQDQLGAYTALVSVVPAPDQLAVESTVKGDNLPPAGSAELLEQLPRQAFAAFAVPDVGAQLTRIIDQIDEAGIPGEVPPNQLKAALSRTGIDVEGLAESIGDIGIYGVGTNRRNVGGAVVIETDDADTIGKTLTSLERILRQRRVEGYSALPGSGAGFSIRDPEELGSKPLVVLARGDRLVIGYGEESAEQAAAAGGQTLGSNPVFQRAADALDGQSPSVFADFQAIFSLVEAVRPDVSEDSDYQAAQRFLQKLEFAVASSETEGDTASARFIVGLTD
jgi:hypothetical protein